MREHIQRLIGDRQRVEFAAANAVEQRRAFDQFVARQRKQPSLRRSFHRVARTPDALQERRDRARRAELADQIDIADIDAELQRSGGDQHLQGAALEPLFGVQPQFLGHAAVVGGDMFFAEAVRQLPGDALRHSAGVDEDERGAMLLRQRRDPFVDLRPDFRRHHGFERRRRDFQGEVAAADVPGVDDLAIRRPCADEKARHGLDRLLRGRQADPLQLAAAQILQSLQRQRQMRAALVRRQRVNLVDDHRPRRRQHFPAGFGTQQNVERFRRRHHDMRRPPTRAVAFGLRSVAGSHPGADIDVRQPLSPQRLADAGQRRLQIFLDVVGQRLQRRDVDDLRFIRQRPLEPAPHQFVDRREERGQRLAGPGRRGDQHISPGFDRRPRPRLRRRRRAESPAEPRGYRGMKKTRAGRDRRDDGHCRPR